MESIALEIQIPTALTTVCLILIGVLGTLVFQLFWHKFHVHDNESCKQDVDICSKEKCIALHKRDQMYLIIIFAIIITFILVDLFVGNKDALDYFSFASTIASIILSVLAIMMTIFSDAKNETSKALINKSIQSLENTSKEVKFYTDGFNKKSDEQKDTFERILENSKKIFETTQTIQADVRNVNKRMASRTFKKDEFVSMQYEQRNIGENNANL